MNLLDFLRKNSGASTVPAGQRTHPYSPSQIEVIGYVENDISLVELLTVFLLGLTMLAIALWVALMRSDPRLRFWDRSIAMWFALTGTIHIVFEGYVRSALSFKSSA